MSKITKALEKAARERRMRHAKVEKATTHGHEVVVPVNVGPESRLGSVTPLTEVRIDPHIIGATDPQSPISEQYRILRTNIKSLSKKPGSKVLMVTSAVNGEGKSVTSLNLALTFARQDNISVCLIDADMRKSSVPKWLGIHNCDSGLSTVLRNGGNFEGELVTLSNPHLTVLPAGPIPDAPAELLQSAAMKRMIATLKQQFDLIFIDAPPVLPVADPGILAEYCDGVLLVVRSGKTQRKVVQQAKARLDQTDAKIIGTVMTHMEYYLPGYQRYYHYYKEEKEKSES